MKKLLLTALLFLPATAKAQQVFFSISSATWCTVSVSTFGAATRVDNFNGSCEGSMTGRTAVRVINPTGNAAINCGYSAAVSSQASNGKLGEEILAGGKVELNLSTADAYWCFAQAAAAAVKISVHQFKPIRSYNQP